MYNTWIRGFLTLAIVLGFSATALSSDSQSVFITDAAASETESDMPDSETESNMMDELDPNDPNIESILEQMDQDYEQATGMSPHLEEEEETELESFGFDIFGVTKRKTIKKQKAQKVETCVRRECPVWVQVVRSRQMLYLYENGEVTAQWPVSTGKGNSTPNLDKHPNGRIYDKYTSSRFPSQGYRGLGNMPYAVFIRDGFAIHGTAESNWKHLGTKASHGCIRLHPDNAYRFNRLVRQHGIDWVWITVQE